MISRLGRTLVVAIFATSLISTSSAVAGPADLDPSFGTGGLVIVPGTDRFDPEAAPLLRTDGKVTLAGLLRNSSDRVFLARFNPAGALDSAFGAAGEVHTNIIAAPDRRAATAQTADGKLLVAGGADNKATVTIQRYTATGAVDTAFGSNGKATATLTSGSYLKVTSIVALADGKTLVSAHTDHGGTPRSFVVLRFNANGAQDLAFGLAGVAKVAFTGKNATAWDLAPLSNGKVIAAGSVGDGTATNLGVVRLNSNGSLDTTFGTSGRVEKDTAAGAADYATSVITDATGAVAVAGPASTKGMVARLTSTGAMDTSFGLAGVQLGGFAAPGTTFTPEDVIADLQGRALAIGKATTAGTTKWAIARLLRTGTAPIDTTFAAGAAQLLPCANTAGFGPTGAAVTSAGRIVILGACNNDGRVAAVRLFGTDAFPTDLTLSVLDQAGTAASDREAGGHERVPLSNIDPTAVLGAVTKFASTTLGSGPLGSGPLGSGPLGSGPLGSGPLGSGPLGSGPLGSGPLGSGPLGSGPLGSGPLGSGPLGSGPLGSGPLGSGSMTGQILISQLPLLKEPTWEARLAPVYAPDPVPPLQTITLGDVYNRNATGKALVDGLTYGDVDVSRTLLREASLAAVLLTRPLQYVAPPAGGWCAFLQDKAKKCGTGANDVEISKTTLLALEFAGVDLKAYYAQPLSLLKPGTDLGARGSNAATLAYVDLRQVDVKRTPLGSRPASQFGALLACGSACTGTLAERQAASPAGWTTATVGQLVDHLNANPGLMSLSLGELLAGLVNTAEIPYQQADPKVLLAAAKLRTDDLQTYKAAFDVDCQQGTGLSLTPALADDARVVPGSGKVAIGTAAATALAGPANGAFALDGVCAGRTGQTKATVTFLAEPGSSLRPSTSAVTLQSAFGQLRRTVRVDVDDSRDPGDAATQALPLTTDEIVHGWISGSRDADHYTFPAPPKGTRISITLSHLPADFDLQLFVPGTDIENSTVRSGPLGSGPLGSGPLGSGPLPDSTADAIDPSIVEPDTVQDLPLGSGPLGSGPLGSGPLGSGPLGSGSINRGTADEAISYVVREADQGKNFAVRVHGYNGETADEPYTLRRLDLVPPPELPCPARTGMSNGVAAAAPTAVPADTQTLYLVNTQRLGALNPITEAGQTLASLEQLAATSGPAKGVVVAVDSDADVRAAYSAWDATPCDESKANDVVERINALVDRLRARSDAEGLRQLRSIVLVGPDAVVPQARVRDDSWLSNEYEYAREARLRSATDDAVAGALGDGYLLTDQAYGDFDAGRTIFVPDVALGRLVETAAEINGQIQRYLEKGGLATPQDAVVMGYDLFSDGAAEQGRALGVTANVGNWNATDARNAINRSSTGFTAVNGHYDHFRGMPAAAFSGTGSPSLLSASTATPQPDSVLFTMGCHSGLNISFQNAGTGAGGSDARLADWAQQMAQAKASWTGSTTYSYGDTETVAYTESILAEMARYLGGKKVTVGQALMYAQHSSVATAGVIDRYFVKSSLALTLYGLPMWRLSETGVGEATMPELAYETGDGAATSEPLSFDLSGSHLQRKDTNRGSFWQADGEEPLVAQGHPVQPLKSTVLPAGEGNAKGYLIESLKTQDIDNVDPVISRPTVDLEAHEPEPPAGSSAFFPARLASVTTEASPEGRRDRVTVAAGQFRGTRQRLFRSIGGRVLRYSTDKDAMLAIRRVHGEVSDVRSGTTVTGHRFSVRVETEGAAARGGNVIYRTNGDLPDANGVITWHRQNLAVGANGLLYTGGVLPSGNRIEEAFVQVYSTTNTIASSTFKVVGYSFEQTVPTPGDPTIVLQPEVPEVGYLTVAPKAVLDPGVHSGARFECRIDGGSWIAVTAGTPFDLPDPKPGEHLIECQGDDGSAGSRQFGVDLLAPTVTATADRAPDSSNGWYTDDVTVTFECADDVSGVSSCPAPKVISAEGAAVPATATVTDLAGRTGSGGITLKIDKTKPTLTSSQSPAANAAGWAKDPVTVSWACSDALSGIASCSGPTTVNEGFEVVVAGSATDKVGHSATAERKVSVDAQNPSMAFSGDWLLLGAERLTGTATDADTTAPVAVSGVADVIVRYQKTGLLGPTGTVIERSVANGGLTLTCDQATGSCQWSAAGPGSTGTWKVTASSTDVAGRAGAQMTGTLSVS
jgi:uncharacterized delta-60 repeat protein